jgi:peptidoglycan/LPS O-acetylase OafA/YrhL
MAWCSRGLGEWLEGRGIVAYAVYGVASLLAAALLYYAVEKPFLRLRGRVLSARSRRPRRLSEA